MTAPTERLQALEGLEKDITLSIQNAASAVTELSKDKPSMKNVEANTQSFLKTLESIESGLSHQINYLTQVATSQPHEGSNYAAQKDLQMAFHRLEHVRSRLSELDRMKIDHKMQDQVRQGAPNGAEASGQGQLERALIGDTPHS